MGLILPEVTEKIRRLLPGTENRWSDEYLYKLVHMADCAIKERGETLWASEEIDLYADTIYYALPTDVIHVRSVQFAIDGSSYEHWLDKKTFRDLDERSLTWSKDRTTIPELYVLMSAPGTSAYSKICIYPGLSAASSQKIRVNHLSCYPDYGAAAVASTAPEWVHVQVYVPHVMALLYATSQPALAIEFWAEYMRNIRRVKATYAQDGLETPVRLGNAE